VSSITHVVKFVIQLVVKTLNNSEFFLHTVFRKQHPIQLDRVNIIYSVICASDRIIALIRDGKSAFFLVHRRFDAILRIF